MISFYILEIIMKSKRKMNNEKQLEDKFKYIYSSKLNLTHSETTNYPISVFILEKVKTY